MPCYHPIRAFKDGQTAEGKMVLKWDQRGTEGVALWLPCGQCIGCRLERARQWAVRCLHESDCHAENCFITLTYDDEHLPKDGSLDLRAFQLFMKKLRKKAGRPKDDGVRFFHCGEYGEESGRPHYHALLFNYDFKDKVLWKEENGCRVYLSAELGEMWPYGFSTIGEVTFESAAYVARYCVKKVTGEKAEDYYGGRRPEYCTMSRRPGVGGKWFDEYAGEVYPHDEVIVRGAACRPPKYYDRLLAKRDQELLEAVKAKRESEARKGEREIVRRPGGACLLLCPVTDEARLAVKERVKMASLRTLKRKV